MDGSGEDRIIITSTAPLGEIELALRGVLESYPGLWRVAMTQELAGGWWSMTVASEGFNRLFILGPDDQNADAVARQLREALQQGRPKPPVRPPWDGRERRMRPR